MKACILAFYLVWAPSFTSIWKASTFHPFLGKGEQPYGPPFCGFTRLTGALHHYIVTKDRLPVFRTDEMKKVLCRAIDEARKSAGFLLFAYVVMIDHLHLLTSRPSTTSDVLRVLKGLTARRVIDYLKVNNYLTSLAKLAHQERERNYKHSLWQMEKNVLPIFSEGMFMEKLNYIHLNPVRAGLSERASDYRWSSARIWQGCPLENEPLSVDKDPLYWRSRA
jgi:REP element-mobilizing transposase RayT